MRSVPDATTRALMLKTGEADIAYALDGVDAEGLKNDPKHQDRRDQARLDLLGRVHRAVGPEIAVARPAACGSAVNYALDREAINEAGCLGFCPPAGVIVPRVMEFALQVEPMPYDPAKAKKLLAEAGYPERLRRRRVHPDPRLPDRRRGDR